MTTLFCYCVKTITIARRTFTLNIRDLRVRVEVDEGVKIGFHRAPLIGDGKYGSERFNRDYGEKGQALYSYKLEFAFTTDAGILEYLRGRVFKVKQVDFAEKYFGISDVTKL